MGAQNVTLLTMPPSSRIGPVTPAERAQIMLAAIAVAIIASHVTLLYVIYQWGCRC